MSVQGGVDVYRIFVGELDDQDADRHYREGMTLATTLQVPPEMWPADRAAFDRYWQESLAKVHIDDAGRDHLYPIAVARMRGMALPRRLRRLPESIALLITTGFLPQRFRDEMRLPWDAARQRRFDRLMAVLRTVNRFLPRFVRLPVQSDALGPGPADQDGASIGQGGEPPSRLITTIIFIKLSSVCKV
jgi:uncharacterized protein (DUF2236 family)